MRAGVRPGIPMNMIDAMLCLALALRIHGTEEAVRDAAYRVRPLVRREIQPVISRVIRCQSPKAFIEKFVQGWWE